MKRRLITLLLLAHVPVLFWAFAPAPKVDALWPVPGQTPREPERVALQVRPEAIVLVGAPAPQAAAAPASGAPQDAGASAPAAAPAPVAVEAAQRPPGAPSGHAAAAAVTPPAVQSVQNPGRQQETEQPPKP